jgi:uncharacterized Zn finger protein
MKTHHSKRSRAPERIDKKRMDEIYRSALRKLADVDTFERGQALFDAGAVTNLQDYEGGYFGFVQDGSGGHYMTSLEVEGPPSSWRCSCTCEERKAGGFCSHLVAAALRRAAEQ